MGGAFLLLGMVLVGATAATFEVEDDLLRRNARSLELRRQLSSRMVGNTARQSLSAPIGRS